MFGVIAVLLDGREGRCALCTAVDGRGMCFANTVYLRWWIFQFVELDNPAPLFVEMGYQASVAICLVSLPEDFAVKSSLFFSLSLR